MFDYALQNGRCIGMVQPNPASSSSNKKNPNIYEIGCAGYVTAFSQTHDNRYELILKGLCRFRVGSELRIQTVLEELKSNGKSLGTILMLNHLEIKKEEKIFWLF